MRIAATSDLHLGFRQFPAVEGGRNVREMDVEKAWATVVDQIIEYEPDIVTIAGDIFHHPRVSDFAKDAFNWGMARLLDQTWAYIIILQGNHDAGKTADVLTPITLARVADREHMGQDRDDVAGDPRLIVVTSPQRVRRVLPKALQTVSVACFPYVARGDDTSYALEPDPDADVNILLMHAAVRGGGDDALPWFYAGDRSIDVGREAERWDMIALGDYHEFQLLNSPLGENAARSPVFYSGSIERTSSNIWDEHRDKGWVSFDTSSREFLFHEIPTRRMVDTDIEDCLGEAYSPDADAVNVCLTQMEKGEMDREIITDAIVRLKVPDFPREEREQIDWGLVRDLKRRCLHFELDLRYAKREKLDAGGHGIRKGVSIADAWTEYTADDPVEVRELGAEYMAVEIEPELEEVAA